MFKTNLKLSLGKSWILGAVYPLDALPKAQTIEFEAVQKRFEAVRAWVEAVQPSEEIFRASASLALAFSCSSSLNLRLIPA
jgi:hypothetical protein